VIKVQQDAGHGGIVEAAGRLERALVVDGPWSARDCVYYNDTAVSCIW